MPMGFRRHPPPPGPPRTGGGLPLSIGTGLSAVPDRVGVARPVPPAAGARPDPTKRSAINNALYWLINGLGLQSQAVPTALDVDTVSPIADVMQKGWALASYSPSTRSSEAGAVTPLPQLWIVAPDQQNTQVIVALSLILAGSSSVMPNRAVLYMAQGTVVAKTATNDFQTWTALATFSQITATYLTTDATVNDSLEGESLTGLTGGTQNVLIVPPGFGIALQMADNILAGQFIRVDMVLATMQGQPGVR